MNHKKITIALANTEMREILIAMLSEAGYEGFEENDNELLAYIGEELFEEEQLQQMLSSFEVGYTTEIVEPRNWNEMWETDIQPVVVDGFCTIRTHFHTIEVATPYDIVITPKMSFGTGHHATTQLMMLGMKDIDFDNKSVLDFGTGTGVLAILAGMLGATDITAIDNDEWSVSNATENMIRNNRERIAVAKASLEDIPQREYHVILANINRHILLQYMSDMYERLFDGGTLLMSGLLTDDEQIVTEAAKAAGFEIEHVSVRNGWISIRVVKQ
jgi:ribosomal protein L11 methyltransferase